MKKAKICLFLWIFIAVLGMIPAVRDAVAEETVLYDAHGKRDPFAPLVTLTSQQLAGVVVVENVDQVVVEGVVYDPRQGSIAVVNGSILKEGAEFSNMKVIKIKPNGILVSVNGVEAFKAIYEEKAK